MKKINNMNNNPNGGAENNITIEKSTLRKHFIKMRTNFDTKKLEQYSADICGKVLSSDLYKTKADIALYMPANNEVDVMPIILDAHKNNKRVYLPRISKKAKGKMDFFLYEKDANLVLSKFGILEPVSTTKLIPGNETLIIMPGVAFDKDKGRIGYGGGYYDRYISKYPFCRTIAVGYSFQIVDTLITDALDIKPEIIICEDYILE